jgi:hypothetical protein
MPVRYRNTVIISFLVLILVPFVLLTDLYPFMRFGMFAEPIKKELQTETFFVKLHTSLGSTIYDPTMDGLDESIFQYLARNHYYRNQSALFLQKLPLGILVGVDKATLYRVVNRPGDNVHSDTTAIESIAP